MTLLWQLSASQLRAAIAAKQISARDAVNACFERIDHHNDRLKAFITLCRARAETEAWQMDEAIAQGKPLGLLQGIPFSAKDLTTTADLRTTYGSLIYQTHIPQYDELCVQRLRRAGAILIGKTNTPEFGMGTHTNNALCGPTANPYNMDYSSGGSSGGAAVAVAMGMGALAQGTDMGGSVRTPASFCGVVGLRPSAGRVPRRQKPLLWDYLDTDGVLARTVEDAALMLSVIAGHDAHDPISLAQPQWQRPDLSSQTCEALYGKIRLAFSSDLGIAIIDKEVNAAFQTAIAQITPLCQDAIETHPDCSMSRPAFETIRAALLLHKQRHHYEKDRHLLSKTVRWNIEQGFGISAEALLDAEAKRDRLYLNFLQFFQKYDILATVTAGVLPFPHTQTDVLEINGIPLHNIIDYLTITYTVSLTGLPAISIPCGWSKTGLPIGLQLVGQPQGEAKLLEFAYLLQEQLGFRHTQLRLIEYPS